MTQRPRAIKTRTYSVDGCSCLISLESEGELQVSKGPRGRVWLVGAREERKRPRYERVPFLQHWDAGSKPTHHALTRCIK